MTVTEIARLAGVSIGTVDRVLHNRGRVSAETRNKIQAIIEQEGFQPNPLARHLKRNKGYRFALLLPKLDSESLYWRMMYDAIVQAADSFAVFSIKTELFPFSRTDRDSLKEVWERMVQSGCDGFVIAPVMQKELLALLEEMPPQAPYCLIDSPLPGARAQTVVAQDPFKGGLVAGRMMELLGGNQGPYAIIRPYTEAFNLNERARGFTQWFRNKPGCAIIDCVCPETNRQEAKRILGELVEAHPSLRGFFVVTSASHIIADILYTSGAKKGRILVGYDPVPENVEFLKTGIIDCLISQRPEEQGRRVITELYRSVVLEETPATEVQMPLDIFIKENLV